MMNINKLFRSEAVVDWLNLELRTTTATPGWYVRRVGAEGCSYVTGLDPASGQVISKTGAQGENTPTTRFSMRIQNPARFKSVNDALTQSAIRDRIDHSAEILVTGIEVSFDMYALPGTQENDLIEMVRIMVTSVNHVTNKPPRAYRHKGETHYPTSERQFNDAIKGGFMFGFGDKDDDLYLRIYYKTTDTHKPLPKEQHRARIEIRLQSNACPIRSLEDLKEFDFARLAKFFKFRQQDPEVKGIYLIDGRALRGGVLNELGRLTDVFNLRGRKRKTAPYTTASPLNEIARDKLRKLTYRWQANARIRRIKKSPIIYARLHKYSGGIGGVEAGRLSRRPNRRRHLDTQSDTRGVDTSFTTIRTK